MGRRGAAFWVGFATTICACGPVQSLVCGPEQGTAAATETDDVSAEHGAGDEPHGGPTRGDARAGAHGAVGSEGYMLPFAWEISPDEPLSRTRAYVAELSRDNATYMERGDEFFARFADSQAPHATVVTCADSRVQPAAFDESPENDDFTVRNIGNQIATSAGSIEYGVEHLATPVLLVLGHTGCGAVKAAMSDTSKLEEPIRRELSPLQVKKHAGDGEPTSTQWRDAVIENVHAQVDAALRSFGGRVGAGKLTVIGGVYDFRNDLGQGRGRIALVNVNGNREPERVAAFATAVTGAAAAPLEREAAEARHLASIARARADAVLARREAGP